MPEQAPPADLTCPTCGEGIQGARRTPHTGLLHVAPCGCQVDPAAFRDLEIARDPQRDRVAFFDPEQPAAWIETDRQIMLEDRR